MQINLAIKNTHKKKKHRILIFHSIYDYFAFYTLSGRIGKVVASHAAVERSIPLRCTDLYYARGAQGVLPMRVRSATSQLDLPSLTPLSEAVVVDCN